MPTDTIEELLLWDSLSIKEINSALDRFSGHTIKVKLNQKKFEAVLAHEKIKSITEIDIIDLTQLQLNVLYNFLPKSNVHKLEISPKRPTVSQKFAEFVQTNPVNQQGIAIILNDKTDPNYQPIVKSEKPKPVNYTSIQDINDLLAEVRKNNKNTLLICNIKIEDTAEDKLAVFKEICRIIQEKDYHHLSLYSLTSNLVLMILENSPKNLHSLTLGLDETNFKKVMQRPDLLNVEHVHLPDLRKHYVPILKQQLSATAIRKLSFTKDKNDMGSEVLNWTFENSEKRAIQINQEKFDKQIFKDKKTRKRKQSVEKPKKNKKVKFDRQTKSMNSSFLKKDEEVSLLRDHSIFPPPSFHKQEFQEFDVTDIHTTDLMKSEIKFLGS